jgi:DNA-binding NarL/FixJ family response regulator
LELSQEKKTQIAACHGKGMTVKEIAKAAKLTEGQVDVFLQSIGKKPLYRKRNYNRLTEEQKEKILELSKDGLNMYEIADKLDIKSATVYKFLHKVKEKEPATAATVTDSQKTDVVTENSTVSISKDNTIEQKSQELLKRISKEFLEIYNRMDESHQHAWDLGELYAGIKEVVGE